MDHSVLSIWDLTIIGGYLILMVEGREDLRPWHAVRIDLYSRLI